MKSGSAVPETFSRDDRLRKRREFDECYSSGVRVSGRFLQVFLLGEADRPRLGLSVSRRVGPSTIRNRVRRRLREIFRRNRSIFQDRGARLVVNVRPSAAQASFEELAEDYRALVKRALSRLPRP